MSAAMKSMNLEKISGLMDQFEKEFEDLDVQTSVMEGAMSQTTATNIPQDSVEVLMRQAADEAGLELKMDLPGPAESTVGQSTKVSQDIKILNVFVYFIDVYVFVNRPPWSKMSCHSVCQDLDRHKM